MAHEDLLHILEIDRMQTLTVVAGEVLRRVKDPLALIRGRAQDLRNQLEFYQRENVQGILDEIFHLENFIRSVESLLAPESKVQSVRPRAVAEEILHFFQARLEQARIHVTNSIPEELSLQIPRGDLRQILLAVVMNAIESLENKATEPRHIFIQHQKVKGQDLFSVEDNGEGVDEEELRNFFLPLQSSKKDHVGLSLAICKKISQSHHWQLKAVSQKGQGTRLELWVPG